MVWFGEKFRFEASGREASPANTVRKLDFVGWVAVTLTITADTPLDGTPPTPVTLSVMVAPSPTGWVEPPCPVPSRVSRWRNGVSGLWLDPPVVDPSL